jgi:hypothetical protein
MESFPSRPCSLFPLALVAKASGTTARCERLSAEEEYSATNMLTLPIPESHEHTMVINELPEYGHRLLVPGKYIQVSVR